MDVQLLKEEGEIDKLVSSQLRSQFLQSWAWGEFQKAAGRSVLRLGFFIGGRMAGLATVFIHRMPLGQSYWYVPRGPVVDEIKDKNEKIKMLSEALAKIVERAREAEALFVRVEPPFTFADMGESLHGFKQTKPQQPADTLHLDLSLDEANLLSSMHEKTRYNIRLAQKKGVTVRRGTSDDLRHFWRINMETVTRDKFQSHGLSYYEKMLGTLPRDMAYLYCAEYEGQVIAANIVMHYGDTATYVHGASSNVSRNVMAPHLLQWQQILDAKKAGFRWYDFWGIAPESSAETHSWAGITRFKKGFGGTQVHYAGTYDYPLKSAMYGAYTFIRKLT